MSIILTAGPVLMTLLGDLEAMKREEYTDMGGVGASFLTTHWSMLEKAGKGQDTDNRALIGMLLERYWKPVYCYVRRKGYNNEDAKDLTQGFFQEVVLGAGKLDYATYLRRLAKLPHDVPLMIEHMKTEQEYDQSRKHVFGIGKQIGIAFE